MQVRKAHSLIGQVYDPQNLAWAWERVKKNRGAGGVDGMTVARFEENRDHYLALLQQKLKDASYRPRPVLRVEIDKPGSTAKRPLGIPTVIDRVCQQAVVNVLEPIFEPTFRDESFGFRPGRSTHMAMKRIWRQLQAGNNWVVDADIADFFSTLDHDWLRKFLEHRIADKRVLRLIDKWVKAGVIEDGTWTASEQGAPQGASASPLLANIYLHYVLDRWVRQWRRRQAKGDVIITRFADDFVAGFEYESDARQFLTDLRERFAKFGLELHPDKTRLIEFGRNAARTRAARGERKPETFDFLGFTHICGKTKNGRFWIKRFTISKRMRAKLAEVKEQLRQRMHLPIPEQGRWLASVVRGHLAYYAVPGNTDRVAAFRTQVTRLWFKALRRRSQRNRLNWVRMHRIATRWLPPARVQHPFPNVRFDARTQGRSPVR